MFLKTRDEEIRKAEAEAAFERKAVEAQADIYRMQAEAEAQEMRMKGYTYQQETSRQVGLYAMRNGGAAGGISGMASDAMQLGVGLGAVGSVIGMTKDAIQPVMQSTLTPEVPAVEGWTCTCGKAGITSKLCQECGAKKPEVWDCACGQTGITS